LIERLGKHGQVQYGSQSVTRDVICGLRAWLTSRRRHDPLLVPRRKPDEKAELPNSQQRCSNGTTAREEELGRDFPDYQLGALPPLGTLVGVNMWSIPRCWHTTRWCLQPALRPSRSNADPELFGTGEITTVTMASGRSEAATTRPRRQVGAAASAISHDSLEHGLGRGAASLVRGSV
jgi:hypothetical protein